MSYRITYGKSSPQQVSELNTEPKEPHSRKCESCGENEVWCSFLADCDDEFTWKCVVCAGED